MWSTGNSVISNKETGDVNSIYKGIFKTPFDDSVYFDKCDGIDVGSDGHGGCGDNCDGFCL